MHFFANPSERNFKNVFGSTELIMPKSANAVKTNALIFFQNKVATSGPYQLGANAKNITQ
jgi:hypothetical protein